MLVSEGGTNDPRSRFGLRRTPPPSAYGDRTVALALMPLLAVFQFPLAAGAVAAGAVSVPIIIHLLNRRRFRVMNWAAMRFLLAAQRKNSRRMRLEQLILLLVRCLLVLLIVLAMCAVTGWAET